MSKFNDFAGARANLSAHKYTLPDGRNAAFERDNPVDILEELADAYNISKLWTQHYMEVYGAEIDIILVTKILGVCGEIEKLAEEVDWLGDLCKRLHEEDVVRLVNWR